MDEVIQTTADKLGLPYDEVEEIVGTMWTSVRWMIRHPHESGSGIEFNSKFLLRIQYFRLVNQVHRMLTTEYKYTPYSRYRAKYWMKVIEDLEGFYHPRAKAWRLKKAAEAGIDYDTLIELHDNYQDQIQKKGKDPLIDF